MSSTIYRKIHQSESAAVFSLACEAFDQFVAPHYQPEGVTEFQRYAAAEVFLKRYETGHFTLVAERSGELVGMLHLRERCHVSMLFVRSSFQRGGIGRGLLAAAGVLAGHTDCLFTVNSSPNAVSAYERLGFRITGSEQCIHGIRFVPMQRSLNTKGGSLMEGQDIRIAIDRHWAASAAGDQVAEHEIYHDDAVCEYPQSGEVIRGRSNLQALRSHHPGRPSGFSIRRIVGKGNLWITAYMIIYQGKRAYTVSIMEFRDGKVSHETQYFADPFDAPAWRAQWVETVAIDNK